MTPLAQSSQPLPEMEASASRQAEGGSRDWQCALQGSRALADFTMGVSEQVTSIESVGDTLEDASVASQEVSRKNRSRRYMTRSLKVSANVPGDVGQQPCVPPTKSSQDEGRKREKNKEKRQRSNTVTRIQSGMRKRVRSKLAQCMLFCCCSQQRGSTITYVFGHEVLASVPAVPHPAY